MDHLAIKCDEFVTKFSVKVVVEDAGAFVTSSVVQARTAADAVAEEAGGSSSSKKKNDDVDERRPFEMVLGKDSVEKMCPKVKLRDIMSLGHWVYDVDSGQRVFVVDVDERRPFEMVLGKDSVEKMCPKVKLRDIMSLGHWVYDVDSGQRVFVLVRGEDDVKKVKKV